MALTRKFMSALGIDADKQDEIIAAHTETVDGLKEEISKLKMEADRLPAVQKELDELKAAAEKDGKDPWKVKYDALKEDFEAFKSEQTAKETKASKTAAYRALLKDTGVAEKRIDAVLRVSDLDAIELDKDGKIKGADKLAESIKTEWADFIPSSEVKGADVSTPPNNSGGSAKTKADIYKKDDNGRFLMDASERQAALAEILNNQTKG